MLDVSSVDGLGLMSSLSHILRDSLVCRDATLQTDC